MYNVADYRAAARRRLPRGLFEFVDRGTEDEKALAAARDALDEIKFLPRTLIDVSQRTTRTTLLGREIAAPLVVAPTGAAGLMAYQGELQVARAAAAADIPFTLATGSLTAIERIAEIEGLAKWFQLYIWPDKNLSRELVARVARAGFEALVVTVDVPVPSNREYNFRNGFTLPFRPSRRNLLDVLSHPRWLLGVLARYAMTTGLPRYENLPESYRSRFTSAPMGRAMPKSDSVTWEDLHALRRAWDGRLIVKGILAPDDAERAVSVGADALIVSTHGGRMLDSALPAIRALPAVLDRIEGRVPVIVDSGFSRGSDIAKALALGASAVMTGRAPLFGVTVGGEKGAADVIEMLRTETLRVMGLLGAPTVGDLDRHHLCIPDGWQLPSARAMEYPLNSKENGWE
ncbi:MAG: alpha-hydroxy-acid oxidizing protein [Rhodobacteraceae bacterium]|nr:alpha-hydroxy-acid oxidizing protein [Paracoccaceae bacterium]